MLTGDVGANVKQSVRNAVLLTSKRIGVCLSACLFDFRTVGGDLLHCVVDV